MPYSEAGELLGHIPRGIELVNNLWKRIMSLPEADSWKTLDPPSPDAVSYTHLDVYKRQV